MWSRQHHQPDAPPGSPNDLLEGPPVQQAALVVERGAFDHLSVAEFHDVLTGEGNLPVGRCLFEKRSSACALHPPTELDRVAFGSHLDAELAIRERRAKMPNLQLEAQLVARCSGSGVLSSSLESSTSSSTSLVLPVFESLHHPTNSALLRLLPCYVSNVVPPAFRRPLHSRTTAETTKTSPLKLRTLRLALMQMRPRPDWQASHYSPGLDLAPSCNSRTWDFIGQSSTMEGLRIGAWVRWVIAARSTAQRGGAGIVGSPV
jgi:hypothetical protein